MIQCFQQEALEILWTRTSSFNLLQEVLWYFNGDLDEKQTRLSAFLFFNLVTFVALCFERAGN